MNEPTTDRPPRVKRKKWVVRVLVGVLGLLLIAAVGGSLWLHGRLKASLPLLDGEQVVEELSAPVTIERDDLGVPTIRAANRIDLARATGFVHAQERFFQMDLLRRQAAGELSAMLGPAPLSLDRRMRVHRFRTLARDYVESAPAELRDLLRAYAEGVNAGLAALDEVLPEYLALRSTPEPWLPEESLLAMFSMYTDLQGDGGRRESALGLLHDLLPQKMYEFLAPWGTEWDAPIVGDVFETPAVPGPEVLDLRSAEREVARAQPRDGVDVERGAVPVTGSNNWAVSGAHTRDGAALVANDMHLGLGMPNIWFRASLVWTDGVESRRVTGVTLPGTPWVISGSSGHVAWGFTNSQGDWHDLVIVEVDPQDEERYLSPPGPQPFQRYTERIEVRGGEPEELEVRWTEWGPIVDEDYLGRPRALRWVAHDLGTTRFGVDGLEQARDIDEALDVANRSIIPAQNFVVADSSGRIAWSLIGPMPRRVGFVGRIPRSWADGTYRWDGRLDPEEYPRVTDPDSGRLWTANNRVVDGEMLRKIGDGGFDTGARARQIRDGLLALEQATPEDLLAVQLDDRALFLERWRELLLDTLTDRAVAADSRRAEMRGLVENDWSGRASVDSVGYRLVRAFRLFLAQQVFEELTRPCKEADERFNFLVIGQYEGPLWKLVTERPPHLLSPQFESWDEQLLAGVDATLDYFLEEQGAELSQRSWGERNTVEIRHPISYAVPQLAVWLDIPQEPLPGDSHMPRVQAPSNGASERFVVSPGREEQGIFQMPGGQSGHPLSPYYRKGHRAWAEGRPAPFLPGPAVHRLTLLP